MRVGDFLEIFLVDSKSTKMNNNNNDIIPKSNKKLTHQV